MSSSSSSSCVDVLPVNGPSRAVVAPDDGVCVEVLRSDLVVPESRPRAVVATSGGRGFVLERGGAFNEWATLTGHVTTLDDRGTTTLVSEAGLTHGLAVDDARGRLYASTADTVHRWLYEYDDEGRPTIRGDAEEVVVDLPSTPDQELHTRSLVLSDDGRSLYVSVGAERDVVADAEDRAAIRAFVMDNDVTTTTTPSRWTDGVVVATGLRNAVGMVTTARRDRLPADNDGGRRPLLWVTDSSPDEKYREDLGGDLSENNPADELNVVSSSSSSYSSYGFPRCWSEYELDDPDASAGRGAQWAWHDPEIFPVPATDAWCRDSTHNVPPAAVFPAHSVPLGVDVYDPPSSSANWPDHCPSGVALPASWAGHVFVALHGSYFGKHRVPGSVVRVPVTRTDDGDDETVVAGDPVYVLRDADDSLLSGVRPVDVAFDDCGRLLVTSDGKTSDLEGRVILRIRGVPDDKDGDAKSTSAGLRGVGGSNSLLCALLLWTSIRFLRR